METVIDNIVNEWFAAYDYNKKNIESDETFTK